MLDFQEKINDFGTPTSFVETRHDAAEFNSSHDELVSFVEAAGLTPTTLSDFLIDQNNDDTTQMSKSAIIFSGMLLKDNTTSANTIILDPFDSNTNLPSAANMEGFTFRFLSLNNHTTAMIIQAFGVAQDLVYPNGDPVDAGGIKSGLVYTIMNVNADFVLINSSSLELSQIDYTPGSSAVGATGGSGTPFSEAGRFSLSQGICHLALSVAFSSLSGPVTTFDIPLPLVGGKNLRNAGSGAGTNAHEVCFVVVVSTSSAVFFDKFTGLNNINVDSIDILGNALGPFSAESVGIEINTSFPFVLV